jgi:CRISPR/Cas system-associated endonuclease/helicase Cas3
VDEFHDILNCHPGRIVPCKTLAWKFGKMSIRIILMTATGPPSRIEKLIKPFGINPGIITKIRSSRDRPEIDMHVIRI